jgi:hypothetical protein
MTSLKQIWAAGRKAKVNGHAWNLDLSVTGREIVLTRLVDVKSHYGLGGLKGGGVRLIRIRRPIATMAEAI